MLAEAEGGDFGTLPPRALILTVLGLYVREVGGWISVRALIRLLSAADVESPAVRSSISRLKRRGLLDAERRDGVAGYALSGFARRILDIGDKRIFARGDHELDGWALVVFSVPESERQKRHTLRTRLSWLGFGTVASGVWIGPGHLLADARSVIESEGLTSYVDLFQAEYVAFGDRADKVADWWDLEALNAQYQLFLDNSAPILKRWSSSRNRPPESCFADYVRVLTLWRRLPYLDPGLPAALVPSSWRGQEASQTFFTLKQMLEGPAHTFADEVLRG